MCVPAAITGSFMISMVMGHRNSLCPLAGSATKVTLDTKWLKSKSEQVCTQGKKQQYRETKDLLDTFTAPPPPPPLKKCNLKQQGGGGGGKTVCSVIIVLLLTFYVFGSRLFWFDMGFQRPLGQEW